MAGFQKTEDEKVGHFEGPDSLVIKNEAILLEGDMEGGGTRAVNCNGEHKNGDVACKSLAFIVGNPVFEDLPIGNSINVNNKDVGEQPEKNGSGLPTNPILKFVAKVKGLLMILCAGMIFTVLSVLSKKMTINVGTYVACEGLFNALLVAPICLYIGISISPTSVTHRRKWFWVRAIGGALAYLGKITGIKNNNIGDATAIFFTAPLWAGLFARIFLKERYTIVNIISTIIGFAGIVLISKPSIIFGQAEVETSMTWSFIILGVAVFAGFMYVAQRGCGDAASTFICTLYIGIFQFILGIIAVPLMGDEFEYPSCYDSRWLLVACGTCAGFGYLLLNHGMAIEKSGPATLMRNADTVVAYLFQIFFFSVSPDWLSLGGAGLIILSTVLVTLDKVYDFSCGINI